jgi:hypothetical protein
MSALLEFECRVPVDGFRVMSFDETKFYNLQPRSDHDWSVDPPPHATEEEQYLLERWGYGIVPHRDFEDYPPEILEVLEPRSDRVKSFDLFKSTSAPFREFADTSTTLEGVTALANRYGSLMGDERIGYVDKWFRSIREMRSAVAAWEKAKAVGDFRKPIGLISSRSRNLYRKTGIDVSIALVENEANGAARLCIRPNDLLDALWTQFALAIDGNQNLRRCAVCRTWFSLEAGEGRSDKLYCSDACRMRAYRKRKQ